MRVACYDRTSVYEEAKISNDAQYDAVKEYVLEKFLNDFQTRENQGGKRIVQLFDSLELGFVRQKKRG